jgi:hypothetical protein
MQRHTHTVQAKRGVVSFPILIMAAVAVEASTTSTFVDGRKSKKRTGSFPAMASKALWPSFAQLSVAHHHIFQISILLCYIASMPRHRQPANQPTLLFVLIVFFATQ